MRILTWNCSGSRFDATRSAALSQLYSADVSVLSEVLDFQDIGANSCAWSGPEPVRGRRKKGVGVLVRPGLTVTRLDSGFDPTAIVARVDGLPAPLRVVGVWSRPPYEKPTAMAVCRARTLFEGKPFIAAGDFNANAYAKWAKVRPFGFEQLRQALEDECGLRSAYHAHRGVGYAQEAEPTFYWYRDRARPFHIDFVFVPECWTQRVTQVQVGNYDQLSAWSDHRPVVVDVTLPDGGLLS